MDVVGTQPWIAAHVKVAQTPETFLAIQMPGLKGIGRELVVRDIEAL